MVFLDSDIVNFSREMLARLVLPALDPIVDYDFVKAYYARFSDRLYGRVTRLFLSPLLAAFARNVGANRVAIGLGAASALALAASWALAGRLVLLPLLAPLAAAWLFYFAAATAAYLRERRAREEAIAMFSRFVNPHVVRQLIERGGLEGAGQARQVTLLFSDIRGFTTLSEKRTPHEVVEILNRYFTRQVDVIFRHGGSLDKFIGDAIMAFWGAPLDDADHARNAVACALDMADTLLAFKAELGDLGRDFDVGIGIHSGPAVVGLIGSDQRLSKCARKRRMPASQRS